MESRTQIARSAGWFDSLFRHKAKATVCFLVVMALAVVATFMAKKTFRSQGGLYFRLGKENSTLDPTASVGESIVVSGANSREREMNSILEIAKSRGAAEVLVDAIGVEPILNDGGLKNEEPSEDDSLTVQLGVRPKLSPREEAIEHVQKRLDVESGSEANIIWVSYEAKSPQFAQEVVDEFMKQYLDLHVKYHRNASSMTFLSEQAEQAKARLSKLEQDLAEKKTELSMSAPEEQRKALVNRSAHVELALLDNEAVERSLEKQVEKLQQMLAKEPATKLVASTSGIGNDAADRMRDRLYSLQIQEQNLLSTRTPTHPEVIAVREQISESKKILTAESDSRTEVTEGINRAREAGEINMFDWLPSLEMHRAKSIALRERLKDVQAELDALSNKERQIDELRREVELADADYRRFAAGRDQARLDEALELERISNVNVVQAATIESTPVRPNWALNLAVGFFLACAASWGFTSFLDMFRPAPVVAQNANTPDESARPNSQRPLREQQATEDAALLREERVAAARETNGVSNGSHDDSPQEVIAATSSRSV